MAKTITPEERAIIADVVACAAAWEHQVRLLGNVLAGDIARAGAKVLTALEAAEVRAEKAENECEHLRNINGSDRYDEVVSDLIDAIQAAEARAETVENECSGKNFMRPDAESVSEQDRAETRALVRGQLREIGIGVTVTCQCGKAVRVVHAYRCWYCGVYFCERCAREHFNVPEGFFRGDAALNPGKEPA